jgi:hypothetical protein
MDTARYKLGNLRTFQSLMSVMFQDVAINGDLPQLPAAFSDIRTLVTNAWPSLRILFTLMN